MTFASLTNVYRSHGNDPFVSGGVSSSVGDLCGVASLLSISRSSGEHEFNCAFPTCTQVEHMATLLPSESIFLLHLVLPHAQIGSHSLALKQADKHTLFDALLLSEGSTVHH